MVNGREEKNVQGHSRSGDRGPRRRSRQQAETGQSNMHTAGERPVSGGGDGRRGAPAARHHMMRTTKCHKTGMGGWRLDEQPPEASRAVKDSTTDQKFWDRRSMSILTPRLVERKSGANDGARVAECQARTHKRSRHRRGNEGAQRNWHRLHVSRVGTQRRRARCGCRHKRWHGDLVRGLADTSPRSCRPHHRCRC